MTLSQEKTLTFPCTFTVAGNETDTITVRPPKVRDAFEIGTPGMSPKDFEFAMMARLCGATVDEMLDLPLGVGTKIREVYENFLVLRDGNTSTVSS